MTKDQFDTRWTPEPFSNCWLWTGWLNCNGYGEIHAREKILAHRLSWQIHRGDIPPGLQVLHHCDTRPCVNPSHLFLGTHADNHRDKIAKGRHRGGLATLTLAQVEEIRTSTETLTKLAKRFGVYPSTIGDVRRGVTWKPISSHNATNNVEQ